MSGRISSERQGRDSLSERRRRSRRRILIASGVFSCVLLGALIYGVWQPSVRISNVVMYGTDQSLASIAKTGLQGSYFGVIPYDSTFFLYESGVRSHLMSAYSDIAAVSIFRNGLTGLSIRVDTRTPIARWCGTPLDATSSPRSNLGADCYFFDSSGFIFAPASTSTQTVNTFTVYAPLDSTRGESSGVNSVGPLRATIAQVEKLPVAFDFARQLGTFGSPVSSIVFHDDEVDEYLASGTRVTYVLGNEQHAFTALTSARANLNVSDGSLIYVDLRFDGKVYLKRKE